MKKGVSKVVLIVSIIVIILILIVGGIIFYLSNKKSNENLENQTSTNDIIQVTQGDDTTKNNVVTETKKEYKVEDYIKIEEYQISNEKKSTMFTKYELKQVNFKNLDAYLVSNFVVKQSGDLAKAVKDVEDLYNETNEKKEAITEINAEINNNVLSIRSYSNIELMEYPAIEYNYLNINLDTKKVLTTTEMITLFGYSKDKLIEAILSSLDQYSDNALKNEANVSKDAFLAKKTEFKSYIIEHLDDFNVYIKDKKMYCDNFSLDLLVDLGYGYPTGGPRLAEVIELQK